MFAESPRLSPSFLWSGHDGSFLENLIPGNNRRPSYKGPDCHRFISAARKIAGNGRDANIQKCKGQRYEMTSATFSAV